jgi:PAB-dependent poly(A)-specific ribonuclease subunit 3
LPHITNLHPSQLQIHSFFLSPTLREDLQRRSAALQESSPIPIPGLPDELHVYHSLHPLEAGTVGTTGPGGAAMEKNKRVFGLGTEVYKGVCELDGNAYVLRRVESGWKAYSWRIKTFEG